MRSAKLQKLIELIVAYISNKHTGRILIVIDFNQGGITQVHKSEFLEQI